MSELTKQKIGELCDTVSSGGLRAASVLIRSHDAALRARLEAQTTRAEQAEAGIAILRRFMDQTIVPFVNAVHESKEPQHFYVGWAKSVKQEILPTYRQSESPGDHSNLRQQVADLTAKLEASEKQTTAVRAYLEMVENGQANAETMRELTDKVATLAHVDDAYHEAQRQYAEAQATIASQKRCLDDDVHSLARLSTQCSQLQSRCRENTQALIKLVGAPGPMDLDDVVMRLQSTLTAQREEIGRLRAALSGLLTEVNHATCLDSDGRRYNTYKSGIELRNLSRAVKMCEQAIDEGTKERS